MPPRLELVVARHAEDLAWLRRVPKAFALTVYNKGDALADTVPLPNIGREAHTYLHHITERYDNLADWTVFVQGYPFDHAPDLHDRLRALAGGSESVGDFHWFGFLADTDDSRGRRLFVPWSKNPERAELPLNEFHEQAFGTPGPSSYRFFVGAQFAVTRAAAQRRPVNFYRQARDVASASPLAPHCFERCWDRVFGADGTAGRLPEGQLTAYFKPIKRLTGSTPVSSSLSACPPPQTELR